VAQAVERDALGASARKPDAPDQSDAELRDVCRLQFTV
jgi:hypothetical protein